MGSHLQQPFFEHVGICQTIHEVQGASTEKDWQKGKKGKSTSF